MSSFSQTVILFAISLIQWVIAWDPAPQPDAAAKLNDLRASLKAHSDPLTAAQADVTKQ